MNYTIKKQLKNIYFIIKVLMRKFLEHLYQKQALSV
jgi:hypothetical protein